jgi:hypothetical protein
MPLNVVLGSMNARVSLALYFVVWVGIAAAVIYLATALGYSLWLAAALAYLLFILVNGSLAYVFRARQLKREGKQPPSYLLYLFFPRGIRHTVEVPRPLRLCLGVIVSVGGGVFVAGSALALTDANFSRMPHPLAAVAMLLVLGIAFAYVGVRLIIVENDEPLFRRRQTTSSRTDVA